MRGPDQTIDADFLSLADQLEPSDVLVFNDTKVIPARLFGRRGEAKIEVTLHQTVQPDAWLCFVKNAKRLKRGQQVLFSEYFSAEVVEKRPDGQVLLTFKASNDGFADALATHGVMPLPPYIASRRPVGEADRADYQTMFADKPGAVAAPTASLHFTQRVMSSLQDRGISHDIVTLHVGAGTFMPVKVDNIDEHKMHTEYCEISAETAQFLTAAKADGRRIIAVGTTALRALEAATMEAGALKAFNGETDLFIRPGYSFRFIDGLITNFHLPKSTLLMLVSALMGRARILSAYTHASNQGYRFFSYGDACLMLP